MVKAQPSKCARKKTKSSGGRGFTKKTVTGRDRRNKKKETVKSNDAVNSENSGCESLDSEDLQYIENQGRNLSFLNGFFKSSETTGKAGKKRKLKAEDLQEADFEKRPRSMLEDLKETQQTLLPFKSKQGLIHRKVEAHLKEEKPTTQVLPYQLPGNTEDDKKKEDDKINEDKSNEDKSRKDDNSKDKDAKDEMITSTVKLLATRQQKLTERKLQIASLASDVVENPEENIQLLKELCDLCKEKDVDIRITTKKLCMVSLVAVFKDIIPGYRIRLPTEEEKKVKVSKEVRKLRDYEEGLLKCYQNFLQFLEQSVQDWVNLKDNKNKTVSVNGFANHRDTTQKMAVLAVQCLCDLMTAVPHFNFRTNILTVLVPWMNDRSLGDKTVQMCCSAFRTLFTQDISGEISLDGVKVIGKFVKAKGYKVHSGVLKTFLSLRINELDVLSLRNKKEEQAEINRKVKNKREKLMKGKMSKKDRKRKKEMKKLEKELQEAEAVQSQETKAKLQTEMLNQVFVTYFRILKHGQQSPLLSTVLEGLARYSLLINVDFFADLMTALQTLVKSQSLPNKDKLNCVLTAFTILSGQGEALNIDPRGFYLSFYGSLLNLHADTEVPIALKCLDALIHRRRRQVPVQRVAAFMKRLLTQTVHQMPNSSLAMLSCAKSLLQVHPKLHDLLDSDNLGTGAFRPEMDDPELCNATCTTAWELALLAGAHFHPTVSTLAVHVVNGAPSKGPGAVISRMSSKEFYRSYDIGQTLLSSFSSLKPQTQTPTKRKLRTFNVAHWKETLVGSSVENAQNFAEKSRGIAFVLPVNDDRRTKKRKQ